MRNPCYARMKSGPGRFSDDGQTDLALLRQEVNTVAPLLQWAPTNNQEFFIVVTSKERKEK